MSAKKAVRKTMQSQEVLSDDDPIGEAVDPTPVAVSSKVAIEPLTLALTRDRRLFDLIRAIRGKGLIGDIGKIMEQFDLTKLPALIDLVSTIMVAGEPTSRAEVSEMLDNILLLIRLFADATTTPIDDQFSDIADQLVKGGAVRALIEKLLSAWLGISTPQKRIDMQSINTMSISWIALFQLLKLIYDLVSEFWNDNEIQVR